MSALAIAKPTPAAARPPRLNGVVRVLSEAQAPDEHLLTRIAVGDREAFARVFQNYAPRIKGYLMRLGAGAAIAEELAQDAMVSVWRRAASYDAGKAKASTWIFVIARNCWIDRLRREKVEFAYREVYEPPPSEELPDQAAERVDTQERMAKALDVLSPDQREVVRLSFFEDKPHSEIAAELDLPLGTVKSRLRLAVAKLRAHWESMS